MTCPIVAFCDHVNATKIHQIVYVPADGRIGQKWYCLRLICSVRPPKVETRKKKWRFIFNSPPLVQFDAQHTHDLVPENSVCLRILNNIVTLSLLVFSYFTVTLR